MSNLGPQKILFSYNGLLQVPGGLTSSLQDITDANGVSSGLQISTTGFSGAVISDTVTITGGTINGTTIGATNPSTGRFSTLTVGSLSGILKGTSGLVSAATSGVDYAPATSGTSILKGNGSGGFSSAVANTDYQSVISATGLLKGAGSGSISGATAGVDYSAGTSALATGILKSTTTTGALSIAVSGTDYAPATSGTSILKGNGAGGFSNASSGTDYAPATSGTSILYGNGSGGFSNVTVGSGLQFSGGTLISTSGGGSVTTVSVVSANGFAGSVANASSTPAITLSTSVTGLLKGNGTAISAATSGTDYAPATSGTSILKGDGAGGFSNAVAGTDYAGLASANTFTSNQIISVNSSSDALRITQTGAGNALVVEDSANPDATPFVVDSSGVVVSGHTSSLTTVSSLGGGIQSVLGTNQIAFAGFRFATDTTGAQFVLNKARGSVTSPTIVADGDNIGQLWWAGYDGASYLRAAAIQAAVDGTPGTNDMPGRLVFSTTADGASSPTERMRIDNAGRVGIGGTPPTGVNFLLAKTISGAATSYGFWQSVVADSSVTSNAFVFSTNAGTTAQAFTLSNLYHYRSAQSTIGAGSTLTNQYGYYADPTLTGATNNYGFYSNIASGTGRWNFYAAGTAANYFAGDVTIDGNTTVKNYTETSYSANSSTAITLNLANGTQQYITLTGSPTITMPTAAAGKSFTLILYTGSGSYTVSWSTVAWANSATPTVTTTASKKDIFNFYSDGTNWYGSIFGQNF